MKEDNQQQLIRAALQQHQHWLYRASGAVCNEASQQVMLFGKDAASTLRTYLSELTPVEQQAFLRGRYTTDGLKAMRNDLNSLLSSFKDSLSSVLEDSGVKLAKYESDYALALVSSVAADIKNPELDPIGVYKAAMNDNPVLGTLYEESLDGVVDNLRNKVFQTVRRGIADGKTTEEIVDSVRGTKDAGFRDGVISSTDNETKALVRTTRTHISNIAYEKTYAAIGVESVIVCATLDGRTSMYCATHDGDVYEVGSDYPTPPYHPNCRTVMMPNMDDGVFKRRSGNTSFKSIGDMTDEEKLEVDYQEADGKNYKQWFGVQNSGFQKEWLGETRYELYKNGDYSLDRFTDPTGRTYTVEELRKLDEKTFKALGL